MQLRLSLRVCVCDLQFSLLCAGINLIRSSNYDGTKETSDAGAGRPATHPIRVLLRKRYRGSVRT